MAIDGADAGGMPIVSPGTDPDGSRASIAAGLMALPGCSMTGEAFAAVGANATGQTLFPADATPPALPNLRRPGKAASDVVTDAAAHVSAFEETS